MRQPDVRKIDTVAHERPSAKRSLANCLRRIEALVSSEHVAFMGPFWKQFP